MDRPHPPATTDSARERPREGAAKALSPQLRRAEEVYRDLLMHEFGFELRLGHHLAFMRAFASPRVAGLLAHTGEIGRDPHRRGTDTGLFIYSLVHAGLDSPTGRHVVDRLCRMHHRWSIRDDDYRWVLGTFVVLGIRIVDRYGWRSLTDAERQASADWHGELGRRMGIPHVPTSYSAFEAELDEYERTTLRRTDAGLGLVRDTLDVVLGDVPPRFQPIALRAAAVIVDEPAHGALGLPTPGRPTELATRLALCAQALRTRARRRVVRRSQPSWFVPGSARTDYPRGWVLDDLGPR